MRSYWISYCDRGKTNPYQSQAFLRKNSTDYTQVLNYTHLPGTVKWDKKNQKLFFFRKSVQHVSEARRSANLRNKKILDHH